MLGAIRHEMADVTTGLYMISAICGLVDAVCFLALGGVFAEMMTGNLLLLAFSIGVGTPLGDSVRYGTAIGLFMMSAAVGAVLIQLGIGWPLLLMSIVFSLAMIPLLFGIISRNSRPYPFGIHPDWIVWRAVAANLKPMAADLGQSPR